MLILHRKYGDYTNVFIIYNLHLITMVSSYHVISMFFLLHLMFKLTINIVTNIITFNILVEF